MIGAVPIARRRRPGFLIVDAMVALSILAITAVLMAQLATWAMTERLRMDAELEGVELAANEIEQARAIPWADLTPEWASKQKLPEHITSRWPDCKLSVKVTPEENRPQVKRVTVEVKWTSAGHLGWRPAVMTALFAARATEGKP